MDGVLKLLNVCIERVYKPVVFTCCVITLTVCKYDICIMLKTAYHDPANEDTGQNRRSERDFGFQVIWLNGLNLFKWLFLYPFFVVCSLSFPHLSTHFGRETSIITQK